MYVYVSVCRGQNLFFISCFGIYGSVCVFVLYEPRLGFNFSLYVHVCEMCDVFIFDWLFVVLFLQISTSL